MHATDSDQSREDKQAGLQHRHADVCQDAPGRLSGSKTSQSVTRPGREEAAGVFRARVPSDTEREFKNTFGLRNGSGAFVCVYKCVCVYVWQYPGGLAASRPAVRRHDASASASAELVLPMNRKHPAQRTQCFLPVT